MTERDDIQKSEPLASTLAVEVLKLPRRKELMDGQWHSYVSLDNVIALLEQAEALKPAAPAGDAGVRGDALKYIYAKLADEGGGTWATYMMMDIEAAYALSTSPQAPAETREMVARIVFFASEDGLECNTPANDPLWNAWKDAPETVECWKAADAILAALPGRDAVLDEAAKVAEDLSVRVAVAIRALKGGAK